jgi:hypothetical protein
MQPDGDLVRTGMGGDAEDQPDYTKAETEPKAAQPDVVAATNTPQEGDGRPRRAQEGDPGEADEGGRRDCPTPN